MSEPIGKSYGGLDIFPVSSKRYRCDKCGQRKVYSTNHFHKIYPECTCGGHRWTCMDVPPEFDKIVWGESIKRQADRLLENPEVDWKDVIPDPTLDDHIACGEKCQICGLNDCTLIHRRSEDGQGRDGFSHQHMCQGCDETQFGTMLDRL